MKRLYAAKVAVGLIHYPVTDKNGRTIAAAVTALDLHDIARSARTYGLDAFYVVTPLRDQQDLVADITDHWISGMGAQYNPDRRKALELIRLHDSLASAAADMAERLKTPPVLVATSAQMAGSDLTYDGLRELPGNGRPVLLLFGTAWGLTPEAVAQADFRLAPIEGLDGYNHLSVRSAAAIILDRMFR